jgi:hypothetical protein
VCRLGSGEGNPTLVLEPAAFGAWNVYNILDCSDLRNKRRAVAGKIKKILNLD